MHYLVTGLSGPSITYTKLYDEGDAFDFPIVKCPFMPCSVPLPLANGIYLFLIFKVL